MAKWANFSKMYFHYMPKVSYIRIHKNFQIAKRPRRDTFQKKAAKCVISSKHIVTKIIHIAKF